MMMLPILCAYLWLQFHFGLTAVVDSAVSGVDEKAKTEENLKFITEFQQKLQAIEETQAFLMSKINSLLSNDQPTSSNQKRIRRDAEGHSQTMENVQGPPGCIPGTAGCPVSVTPYSAGSSCILCPAGPRGYPGPPGSHGRDGRDGRDSVAVITASEHFEGPHQSHRPSYYAPASNTSGSVYVRWGHSECPSYSTLIYAGSAAGGHYGASGNGANQLCLPDDPDYDNPVAGVGTSRAFLYSIEYQIDNFPTLESRLWLDVACAVCKAPSRYGQLMIPGKHACPSAEWTLEYSGYLMAERSHSAHKRSMYICVDDEMRSTERTHGANSVRGLLDLVEGRCSASGGGLPCGQYIDGYELTCAVCTQ